MRWNVFRKWYRTHWGRKESVLDFFDIFAFLIFIAWIAWVIRFFVFMPYTVEWSSMANTFHNKDFIIVDKITSKYGSLERWDVIVFVPPGKEIPFIKRIIWLPGEVVKLQWWKVYICKSEEEDIKTCNNLPEKYLWADVTTEARCGVSTFNVQGWYLAFWDNRWFSTDSRCCFWLGCLSGTNYIITPNRIIWKVFWRIFPDPASFSNENSRYK